MKQQIQKRCLAFVVAAFLAVTGLAGQPARAYAGYNPPTAPRYPSRPGRLPAFLADPQGISTSPGGPRP